jgi:predicted NUDIX family phosphoesterase
MDSGALCPNLRFGRALPDAAGQTPLPGGNNHAERNRFVRMILVVERKHLFPGLSPQGFLPADAVDLDALADRLFFAERRYMERNAHYKQIIPYLVLQRGGGDRDRVLAYQRRAKHTEQRLGGLWSVGFGGHIEPLDRDGETGAALGLVRAAAVRELREETGLDLATDAIDLAGRGRFERPFRRRLPREPG